MSEIIAKEKLIELKNAIEAMRTPLADSVQSCINARVQEVIKILAHLDPIAEFFAAYEKVDIRLHSLHICHGIAQNIGVAAAENGIYGYDYDKAFIDLILDTYTKELDETLELI